MIAVGAKSAKPKAPAWSTSRRDAARKTRSLARRTGIPFIAPLDESAMFLDGFGQFTGKNASEVPDDVVAELKAARIPGGARKISARLSALLAVQIGAGLPPGGRMVHPHGLARSHSATSCPTINWIPAEGEARELDWLRNMSDWMISKKRFWGLALPIWVCGECEHFMVIGSREELREKRWRAGICSTAIRRTGRMWMRSRSAARSAARWLRALKTWAIRGSMPASSRSARWATPPIARTGRNGSRPTWCLKASRGSSATGSIRCSP